LRVQCGQHLQDRDLPGVAVGFERGACVAAERGVALLARSSIAVRLRAARTFSKH
jgi:hypothetical protein